MVSLYTVRLKELMDSWKNGMTVDWKRRLRPWTIGWERGIMMMIMIIMCLTLSMQCTLWLDRPAACFNRLTISNAFSEVSFFMPPSTMIIFIMISQKKNKIWNTIWWASCYLEKLCHVVRRASYESLQGKGFSSLFHEKMTDFKVWCEVVPVTTYLAKRKGEREIETRGVIWNGCGSGANVTYHNNCTLLVIIAVVKLKKKMETRWRRNWRSHHPCPKKFSCIK